MMPKYIRHVGQINALVHEYEDEVRKLNRLIDMEDDERTKDILVELRNDHISAKKRLEKFLDEQGDVFK